MDRQMYEQLDKWINRYIDRWTDKCIYLSCPVYLFIFLSVHYIDLSIYLPIQQIYISIYLYSRSNYLHRVQSIYIPVERRFRQIIANGGTITTIFFLPVKQIYLTVQFNYLSIYIPVERTEGLDSQKVGLVQPFCLSTSPKKKYMTIFILNLVLF